MANRSYLYSMTNQPKTYADRPVKVNSLSEWNYKIPLVYLVLVSGNTKLCASLIAAPEEGFENSEAHVEYYALSGDFEIGLQRVQKLLASLMPLMAEDGNFADEVNSTIAFLKENQLDYAYLETCELDMMTASSSEDFHERSNLYVSLAKALGDVIDELPDDTEAASKQIYQSIQSFDDPRYMILSGLALDHTYDYKEQEIVLGLSNWSDCLYFGIWNKAEYEENS